MNYKEIKDKIKTKEGLKELVHLFSPIFYQIDTVEKKFEQEDLIEYIYAKKVLQNITAYNLKLNKVVHLLDQDIENKKSATIKKMAKNSEDNGERFYVNTAKELAKQKIEYEIRILTLFKIYLENTETIKFSVQSLLRLTMEENLRGV